MTNSRYPRQGHPLVPFMLREIFPENLADLDETAWQRFSVEECRSFAERVIAHARASLSVIREKVGARLLPAPPVGLELGDLELEVRTYRCLEGLGLVRNFQNVQSFTINDLMAVKNFGAKSLIDILTSLEYELLQSSLGVVRESEVAQADYSEANLLSKEEIQTIRECFASGERLPLRLRKRRIPNLPEGLELTRLDLKNRTYNCLEKADFIKSPQRLSEESIVSLMALPAFGRDSLLDLLTALEPYFIFSKEDKERHVKAEEELVAVARQLEQTPYVELIKSNDLRFGQFIRAIGANAQNAQMIAESILAGTYVPADPVATTLQIRQLIEGIKASLRLKLEDELVSLIVRPRSERNLEIFIRRFGLHGEPISTLQELADQFGMTRERVRQICDTLERTVEGKQPFAPMLDQALKLVGRELPGIASEIEEKLIAEGITKKTFQLESLQSAAALLGREVSFSIAEVGAQRAVTAVEASHSAKKVLSIVRRTIRHWGVATMEDVIAQTSERTSFSPDVVKGIITGQTDFRWLDEANGWFWLRSISDNRLLNQIKKVLSVGERVDIAELRAGVCRHHRMEGIAPPQHVLVKLCRQVPWGRVEENTVRAEPPFDWRQTLADTEQILTEILKAHGPVMSRERLEVESLARGINRTTFYAYLNYSPIITKYTRGIYGLRGVRVPLGVLDSLIRATPRGKVLRNYGWMGDSQLWVGYELSESVIGRGACNVPAELSDFLQGEFRLCASDGTHIGTLSFNGSQGWGLKAFFNRKGGEPGDYLALLFDLPAHTVIARLGDENVVAELQLSDEILRDESGTVKDSNEEDASLEGFLQRMGWVEDDRSTSEGNAKDFGLLNNHK